MSTSAIVSSSAATTAIQVAGDVAGKGLNWDRDRRQIQLQREGLKGQVTLGLMQAGATLTRDSVLAICQAYAVDRQCARDIVALIATHDVAIASAEARVAVSKERSRRHAECHETARARIKAWNDYQAGLRDLCVNNKISAETYLQLSSGAGLLP